MGTENISTKAQFIGKFYNFLNTTQARINFIYGGASSGKSHSVAQFFLKKFYEDEKDKEFLIIRKTLPALRITAYKVILDLIYQYKLPRNLNKSEMLLTYNGNEMRFKSLDDPEKIKSFNVNYIWAEELTEFTLEDFRRLLLILRAPNDKPNQIFGTFNPIDAYHWINTKFLSRGTKKNMLSLHSTYKDNPFNTEEYINELLDLKGEDDYSYSVYAEGKWGVRKNIIYTDWETIGFEKFPSIESCDFVIYGIDFGFNNPSAITEIRSKDRVLWERELLYETHLTNPMLIEKAKELIPNRLFDIYADSAEPDRIKEFKGAGFKNIRGAKKGEKSVITGIDFVKRHKTYISTDSVNLINEKRAYKYKEDTISGKVLEEPVKWMDHLMDAERMAIYSHLSRMGVKKGSVYFKGIKKQPVKKTDMEDKDIETEKKELVILSQRTVTNGQNRKGKVYFSGM